jgi:hypothetical protein
MLLDEVPLVEAVVATPLFLRHGDLARAYPDEQEKYLVQAREELERLRASGTVLEIHDEEQGRLVALLEE